MEELSQSGAFTGALDPDGLEATLHSIRYYAAIRKRKDDVSAIARNTGWNEYAIQQIRNHIFFPLTIWEVRSQNGLIRIITWRFPGSG